MARILLLSRMDCCVKCFGPFVTMYLLIWLTFHCRTIYSVLARVYFVLYLDAFCTILQVLMIHKLDLKLYDIV